MKATPTVPPMADANATGDNVIPKRRKSDWQPAKTEPRCRDWTPDEARDHADSLSMRLNGAAQMLKLAAFAAEARRTLTDIEAALEWRPKVRDDLRNHVASMTSWDEMPDVSGDVLTCIAMSIDEANEGLLELVYDQTYGQAAKKAA